MLHTFSTWKSAKEGLWRETQLLYCLAHHKLQSGFFVVVTIIIVIMMLRMGAYR